MPMLLGVLAGALFIAVLVYLLLDLKGGGDGHS